MFSDPAYPAPPARSRYCVTGSAALIADTLIDAGDLADRMREVVGQARHRHQPLVVDVVLHCAPTPPGTKSMFSPCRVRQAML